MFNHCCVCHLLCTKSLLCEAFGVHRLTVVSAAHFEEERKWKEQYPHLEIWLEDATPVEKPVDFDELAEVELYGARGPEDPSHHGRGGQSRGGPVPVGVSGAVGGWRHAASQWKTLSSDADERVLLSKMHPIPFSQEACAWESQLERHSTDVTIVTQLSVDRISRLEVRLIY